MLSAISTIRNVGYETGINPWGVDQRARQAGKMPQQENRSSDSVEVDDKGMSPKGGQSGKNAPNGLTAEQQSQVDEMARTDREVRAHEQAHIAAGGVLVRGGANFVYQAGPDGKRYAVGGEVSIDTSPVKDDPAATIGKAFHIQRTALAPANPSSQDRQVAAAASSMAFQAQAELAKRSYQDKSSNNQSTPEVGVVFGMMA